MAVAVAVDDEADEFHDHESIEHRSLIVWLLIMAIAQ
jgi:hypothetical protein